MKIFLPNIWILAKLRGLKNQKYQFDQVFPESIEFEEEVELTFRSELWFDFEYPFDSFCFSSDNKA